MITLNQGIEPIYQGKRFKDLTNDELIECANSFIEQGFKYLKPVTKNDGLYIETLRPILLEMTGLKLSDIYLTYKQKYLHLQTIS